MQDIFKSFLSNMPFGKKNKGLNIFIVEDNEMYSKQLEFYLKSNIPNITSISVFPVAELAIDEIHKKNIPDVLIMDHFLNSQYADAALGFDILKSLKVQYKKIFMILLTSQSNIDFAVKAIKENICKYIIKDGDAFSRVTALINEKFK